MRPSESSHRRHKAMPGGRQSLGETLLPKRGAEPG